MEKNGLECGELIRKLVNDAKSCTKEEKRKLCQILHKFDSDLNLCLKSITETENTIYNTDMLLNMLELSSNRRSN